MTIKFVNNYGTLLAANITSAATSITVSAGTGAGLPTLSGGDVCYATLITPYTQSPFEVVKITAISTDTLTVVRAQDSTSAIAWPLGTALDVRIPRVVLNSFVQSAIALGTMATQDANNVAITGGSITGITDLAVVDGGTGASTAANARTNLGTAASGAVTASGLTMTTARLLGRTTAATGAIEEVTVGSGLTLSGTNLAMTLPNIAPGQLTNSLGANVNLTNTANYFDGPSIAQGSSGTWWVSGQVVVNDTNLGGGNISVKLWDGTTVIDSGATDLGVGGGIAGNLRKTISLSGYITSPAGNIRISVKNDTSTANTAILFNSSGNSKDSTISAFRIA